MTENTVIEQAALRYILACIQEFYEKGDQL